MKKLVLIVAGLLLVFSTSAVVLAQGYETMPEDAFILPLGVEGTGYEELEPGVRGGTLYVSTISNPRKWNDVTAHETSTTAYTNQMLRGLVRRHEVTNAFQPELAKSWDVSEDGLVVTFHLRQGIKWSDGTPFTADDVLFTYNDLIYNEDIETDSRDGLELPDGTFPVIEKVDDNTITVTMSMVFRPIFNQLQLNIMPKHKLAQYVHKLNPDVPAGTFNEVWGLDTDPADLVGLGPYLVESYTPDQQVVMVRNPYYYHYDQNGVQLPYVDRWFVLIVASQDVSLLKFRNGEIDCFGARPSDVPILKREEAIKDFTLLVGTGVYGTLWISFNQDFGLGEDAPAKDQLRELFRNIKFRQAVCHAIDKQTIINNLYNGLATPQWSPVSTPSPFYAGREYYGGPVTEANAVTYEYDLAEANRLLDEIGILDTDGDGIREFADGTPVEFELNTNSGNTLREGFSLIMQEDLTNIGLKVNFNPVDFNTLVTRLLGGTIYEAVVLGLTGGDEPHGGANVYLTTGGLHFWHYSAAEEPFEHEKRIEELLDLGVGTFDNDEAFEYYKEYQILYATQDLGMHFSVNQAFTYAYYNYVGNGNVASPICSPSGNNGRSADLVYIKTG